MGPGRYAVALAAQGYQVTLLDLSQENLTVAQKKATESHVTLAGTIHANATHLPMIANETYDAALLLGATVSFAATQTDRHAAVNEAVRILKPGGVLFAAFLGPYDPVSYGRHPRPPPGFCSIKTRWSAFSAPASTSAATTTATSSMPTSSIQRKFRRSWNRTI